MVRTQSVATTLGVFSVALGLCAACVSSPRSEPAGTAAAPNAPNVPQAAPQSLAPPQESEGKMNESPGEFAQPPPSPAAPVQPNSAAAPAPARKASGVSRRRESDNPRPARAGAAASDKQSYADDESMLAGPRNLLQPELRPTQEDPPDLRAALVDLQSAVDQLSTGHSCNEGCKAYESMQRAANRICDIVSTRDPSRRCAAARSRVSSAEQDVKNRCGHCPG
jgi:hypothetical protein